MIIKKCSLLNCFYFGITYAVYHFYFINLRLSFGIKLLLQTIVFSLQFDCRTVDASSRLATVANDDGAIYGRYRWPPLTKVLLDATMPPAPDSFVSFPQMAPVSAVLDVEVYTGVVSGWPATDGGVGKTAIVGGRIIAAAAATAAGFNPVAAGWRRSRLLYSEYMDFSPAASRPYAAAGNAADVVPAEVSRDSIGARRSAIDAARKSTSDRPTRSLTSRPGPHITFHSLNTRLSFLPDECLRRT